MKIEDIYAEQNNEESLLFQCSINEDRNADGTLKGLEVWTSYNEEIYYKVDEKGVIREEIIGDDENNQSITKYDEDGKILSCSENYFGYNTGGDYSKSYTEYNKQGKPIYYKYFKEGPLDPNDIDAETYVELELSKTYKNGNYKFSINANSSNFNNITFYNENGKKITEEDFITNYSTKDDKEDLKFFYKTFPKYLEKKLEGKDEDYKKIFDFVSEESKENKETSQLTANKNQSELALKEEELKKLEEEEKSISEAEKLIEQNENIKGNELQD